jgi:hypothetical protein
MTAPGPQEHLNARAWNTLQSAGQYCEQLIQKVTDITNA